MSVIDEVEKLIQSTLSENHFELVDAQYRKEGGRWVLRLFIDRLGAAQEPVLNPEISGGSSRPAGSTVTLDDCERVSNLVGALLDSSRLLESSYLLEVSSPGINRHLTREEHFRKYVGQKAKVAIFSPLTPEKNQRNFSGIILGCQDGILELNDAVSGKVEIPLSSIAKAHLDVL